MWKFVRTPATCSWGIGSQLNPIDVELVLKPVNRAGETWGAEANDEFTFSIENSKTKGKNWENEANITFKSLGLHERCELTGSQRWWSTSDLDAIFVLFSLFLLWVLETPSRWQIYGYGYFSDVTFVKTRLYTANNQHSRKNPNWNGPGINGIPGNVFPFNLCCPQLTHREAWLNPVTLRGKPRKMELWRKRWHEVTWSMSRHKTSYI